MCEWINKCMSIEYVYSVSMNNYVYHHKFEPIKHGKRRRIRIVKSVGKKEKNNGFHSGNLFKS